MFRVPTSVGCFGGRKNPTKVGTLNACHHWLRSGGIGSWSGPRYGAPLRRASRCSRRLRLSFAEFDTKVAGAYTIVVMSNYDPPAAEKVAKQIRLWLVGKTN